MARPKDGYHTADGIEAPGVTSVLRGCQDPGGLTWWAYKQGLAHGEAGVRPKGGPYAERDAAAIVGTFVHGRIEAFLTTGDINAQPVGVDPVPPNYEEKAALAYEAFQAWLSGTRLRITPLEQPLISEVHRFGGTPDAIAEGPDGTRALVDWKTSKKYHESQLAQVAAYQHLWDETNSDAPITGGVHIVRFSKQGDFEHRFFSVKHRGLIAAWRRFLCAREIYDLDRAISGKDD